MEISGYFIFFVFIITTLVVGFCTWNAVNYFKLKDDNTSNPTLSKTLENMLAIFNIVLAALAFIIWLLCLYYAYSYFTRRSYGFEDSYRDASLGEFAQMTRSSSPKMTNINRNIQGSYREAGLGEFPQMTRTSSPKMMDNNQSIPTGFNRNSPMNMNSKMMIY